MSDFSIKTDSKTRMALIKLGTLTKDMEKGIAKGFEELGASLVRTAQNQSLNEPKFGRKYKIRQDGVIKLHRASAKDQSPAVLSGDYFEGFGYEASGAKQLEFGNEVEYAGYLEEGTDNMKPRPGLTNAVNVSVRNSRIYLETNIGKELDL